MKKKKTKSILATIVTVIVAFIYQSYLAPKKSTSYSRKSSAKLVLTKHAKCRMDCRKIDKGEIEMVLRDGKINHRKSEPQKKPCPVYSREAYSKRDRQEIRVVSADCKDSQTIITVIDLSNKYDCYCK